MTHPIDGPQDDTCPTCHEPTSGAVCTHDNEPDPDLERDWQAYMDDWPH